MTHTTDAADSAAHDEQVSTAIGAGGGVAAGAIAGAVMAGPVGAVAGAAVGAVIGGLGSRMLTEDFDTSAVDKHWRDRHADASYHEGDLAYDDYAPAYHLGAAARSHYPDASFEDAEAAMEAEYKGLHGDSRLAWERAREAARASFHTTYF